MTRVTLNRCLIGLITLISSIAISSACNAKDSLGDEPGKQPAAQGDSSDKDEGAERGGEDEKGQEPIDPGLGDDTLPCPPKGSTLYLGFDHALTINYEETSITHFLHEGWLQLKVTDDDGTIASQDAPSLTYTMEGVMSEECSLKSEGTMKPSAHGSCEAGVVGLFIEENWLPLKGEMECIDSDGDIYILPFNVPAMGVQTHSGQDGTGEIFYLVEGAEGYSTMRPFLEGEGYHTWTLYTEDVPLVPIVP